MASISSLGAGSGIDLQSLVDGLVAAERQLRLGPLDSRQAIATERISAYGLLQSAASLFDSSLSSLGNISTFQSRNASSSDEESFTVTAQASAGLGSYSVEVIDAGAAQTLIGSGLRDVTNTVLTSADVGIGGGTLTIQQGTQTAFTVDIASQASSLNDIAEAINTATGNTGVAATVINADTGPVLAINAEDSGLDNQIAIVVDDIDNDDTDTSGLSQLTFDVAIPASNLTQQTAAANAEISFNGIQVTSTSGRSFANVIQGVTIDVLKATTEAATLTVSKDTAAATSAINEFISSYNSLIDSVNELGRGASEEGGTAGVLVGDSVVRSLTSQIRRALFNSLDASQPAGIRNLSEIGVQIDRSGKLSLDSTRFEDLLESNFDDVARLLAADGEPVAQSQQLRSGDFDTVTSVVGTGVLTITTGESSFDVTVTAGNENLTQVRDLINNATDNTGVTASIILVDDGVGGTNAQLILSANAEGVSISVSAQDDDADNTDPLGLSALVSGNLTELVSAEREAPAGIIVGLQSVVKGFIGEGADAGIIAARTDGLNDEIERIQDQRIQQEFRLESFESRLVSQFSALDLLVANLQSNGNFLLTQLASISQIPNSRNNSDNG